MVVLHREIIVLTIKIHSNGVFSAGDPNDLGRSMQRVGHDWATELNDVLYSACEALILL